MPRPKVPFWEKVAVGDPDECWPWLSYRNRGGYGCWQPRIGYKVMAHRHAYEDKVGPIPEGLVIDHLCRNRACCNPAHMEPVTIGENVMRGETLSAALARRTECPQGHAYTPENTKRNSGGHRECRECDKARKRRAYQLAKAG